MILTKIPLSYNICIQGCMDTYHTNIFYFIAIFVIKCSSITIVINFKKSKDNSYQLLSTIKLQWKYCTPEIITKWVFTVINIGF